MRPLDTYTLDHVADLLARGASVATIRALATEARQRPPTLADWVAAADETLPPQTPHASRLLGIVELAAPGMFVQLNEDLTREPTVRAVVYTRATAEYGGGVTRYDVDTPTNCARSSPCSPTLPRRPDADDVGRRHERGLGVALGDPDACALEPGEDVADRRRAPEEHRADDPGA